MDALTLEELSHAFGAVQAVRDVSLTLAPGELVCLLGPSGCGKTTLLRMIAGFESPGDGTILIDGEDMLPVPPNKRPINMVFQSYAVFPHMTVADNIAYGLRVTGTPSGVGMGFTPPRYLQPGDEVVVDVTGVGELRNPVTE